MLNYCGRYVSPARKRVFAQTVPRCTPYRRASVVTLMPCARAVRIASTSSAVSGVRVRPVGSVEAATSGSWASSWWSATVADH